MSLIIVLFLLVVCLGCSVYTQTDGLLSERKRINSLVPNGYAMEYKYALTRFVELWDLQHKIAKDIGYEQAWDEIDRIIWRRLSSYPPEIKRTFEKNTLHHYQLLEWYVVATSRYDVIKQGRNPMVSGGVDPQPLPKDLRYVLAAGKTALSRSKEFSERQYQEYLKQDAASEKELEFIKNGRTPKWSM